jgi:hypothetical protein
MPGREQLGDALLRLLGDPAVDLLARLIGGADVVDEAQPRPEARGEGLEVGVLQRVVALGERRVRDAEDELVVLAVVIGDGAVPLGEGGIQGVEPCRMLVRCGVVHDGIHLGCRVAARAGPRHPERQRDARRGVDQVPVALGREPVEVEAEGIDGGCGGGGVVGGGLGSRKIGGGELDRGGGAARRDDERERQDRTDEAPHTNRTRWRVPQFRVASTGGAGAYIPYLLRRG